ncbi:MULTISPECIES: nuclear transport factor 2 family protein [unclassified Novosphingobium]|uniref:nuclear transport factor 2 family protein n=1 Tax=unclassified Novosphingobium TaxID=2644732 RepID=UPI00135902D8|nr:MULTISPECIES: nuclear transport factor 2 family protein [unclassified Novosphingobium]
MTDILAELADKQAITEQIYRYCRSVDRLDVPLGHSVFHEDATADYGPHGYSGPGRGAIDWICEAHGNLLHHTHQVSNILIELAGTRASSEAYVTATLRMEREGRTMQIENWARYCDTWSKRGGHWAIDRRQTVIEFDAISEVTPMKKHETATRGKDDPSYAILESRS